MHPGDEETAVAWGADVAFCLANGWALQMPAERIRSHQRRLIDSPPEGLLRLGIEMDGRLIGFVDLADLNEQSGELGIAIGESGLWGGGIGAQAGRLMLAHAFEVRELEFVWAEVHLPNRRSQALMRKLGMTETGREGTDEYQGEVVPMVQYRIEREQFASAQVGQPVMGVDEIIEQTPGNVD